MKAGFRYLGGTYFIDQARGPGLARTHLEYQVIRLGAEIDYEFMDNFTLSLDAGLSVYRRFDYYDRGYKLTGSTTPLVSVGLGRRF